MSAAELPAGRPLWLDAESPAQLPSAESTMPPSALDLRELFDRNHASVWRLLRRLGVPPAQIDDAAQEVFWVATRRLADIKPDRERAFLYGVALRVAADDARRRRATPPLSEPEVLSRIVDDTPGPEEQFQQREARELLDVVLQRMPIELRTAFVLAELEGLEVRDIAALEGLPVGTASSRLRRAREEFGAITHRVRAELMARGRRL